MFYSVVVVLPTFDREHVLVKKSRNIGLLAQMVGLTYIRVWLQRTANSDAIDCCRLLGVGCMFSVYDVITHYLFTAKFIFCPRLCCLFGSETTKSSFGLPVLPVTVLDTDICDDDFMHKGS